MLKTLFNSNNSYALYAGAGCLAEAEFCCWILAPDLAAAALPPAWSLLKV